MTLRESYVSYCASDFDATSRFYEDVLGLERVTGWDRPDGRGAYFGRVGVTVVEVSGAASGASALVAPGDGFAVTLIVDDLGQALAQIARAGAATEEVVEERWGRYVSLRDPDGVLVYVMERIGQSAADAHAFFRGGHGEAGSGSRARTCTPGYERAGSGRIVSGP